MVADRDQWLADRRQYITGSWLAPILGIPSPAGTELDAWAWYVHGYGSEETEPMRRGKQLEGPILAMFAEAHDGAHVGRWPAYRLAGADCATTNSFQASRPKLAQLLHCRQAPLIGEVSNDT